jgi:zinc transport system ATP-binding protein
MRIVSLKDIWVYYQRESALEGITLDIEEGEFLGLIGPNGGGKTTLLKVILGLIKPDRGKAEVFGKHPQNLGRKHHLIGYIPQRSLIDWGFPASVFDVVMMGRYGRLGLFRRPTSKDREVVLQSLERVGMADFVRRQIGQLSGGEQQRVFIARALACEPKLLLLDEPVAGVDATAQDMFYHSLKGLQEELGLTIVIVSHDIGVISSYVEKLACLNHILYSHDIPSEVLTNGVLKQAYGCEVELLVHGWIPHRVVERHK